MATRTITHFRVNAALMNDITAILFELPAKASREVLNRIESKECEPIFKVDLLPLKKAAKKKIAKRKRRS